MQLHIVVFPWLAFGHMIPFLELSESLARRGHRISFLSTPRNLERLPKVPPQLHQLIDFVSLPLPQIDGLPDNAEATTDLSPDQVQYLKKASDGLDGPLATFIREASPKPDWIIEDFSYHWLPPLCRGFGVRCIFFCIFPAWSFALFDRLSQISVGGTASVDQLVHILTKPSKWIGARTSLIPAAAKLAYRLHDARQLVDATTTSNASGVSDVYRFKLTVDGCEAVAVRSSSNEFGTAGWLSLLGDLGSSKPVIPVGLLPPHENGSGSSYQTTDETAKMMEWLDHQQAHAVAYVALGSEAVLPTELLHELALGIELSNIPFLWALRKPAAMLLPQGFQERTKDRGVVAMGWVPQLKMLAHPSVGGFLTHCGWSSLVEGLRFGHPLILLPIFGDQGINARVMVEAMVGVEVERISEEDGSFTREAVAGALRSAMGAEQLRLRAKQESKVLTADSGEYVDAFVQFLLNHPK